MCLVSSVIAAKAPGSSYGIGRGLVVGLVLGMNRGGFQVELALVATEFAVSTGFGDRNRRERAPAVDTPIGAVIMTSVGPMCTRRLLARRGDFPGRAAADAAARKQSRGTNRARPRAKVTARQELVKPEFTGGLQYVP
jgi:hypothetical protein